MNRSESLEKLAVSLSAVQGILEAASKDKLNPHFKSKYADLASIWDACRAPLSSNGLSVIQTTKPGPERGIILETMLLHSSGQWISGEIPIECDLKNPQVIGSALTYARRYGLAAMVGVCPDDDDGQAAVPQQRSQGGQRNGQQQDRSGPRPNPPAEQPRKPVESWSATAKALCDQANADWFTHMTLCDVQPRIKGEHKELINPHQLTNHLCSHAIEKGAIKLDDVSEANADGELIRDKVKAWTAVGQMHTKIPNKVRREATEYIAKKRAEACRDLDIATEHPVSAN